MLLDESECNLSIASMEQTPENPVSDVPPLGATNDAKHSAVMALVKVMDTDAGESKLVLNDEAITAIRDIKGPISVIAIAGAYRWVYCIEINRHADMNVEKLA